MKSLSSAHRRYYPKPCGRERSRKNSRRLTRLFRAYREHGDAEALDILYREHLRLAAFCARKYVKRAADYDDLYQEACLGLLDALKRYDPDRGVEFSTYATYYIEGAVKQYFRDKGWPCSAPRSVKSLSLRVRDMARQLGRDPTRQEVLDDGTIPADKVDCALAAAQAWSAICLEPDDSAFASPASSPFLVCEDSSFDSIAFKLDMKAAAAKSLSFDELNALYLYYYQNLSKRAVAENMAVTENRVRRLLENAVKKLGRALEDEDDQVKASRSSADNGALIARYD